MSEFIKQDCPLCDAAAEFCWANSGNRKYFTCPNCTEYQISAGAEKRLLADHPVRRPQYAKEAARHGSDEIFVILRTNPPNDTDPIDARYVPRAEVPDCD
jgi:hypothetical protein